MIDIAAQIYEMALEEGSTRIRRCSMPSDGSSSGRAPERIGSSNVTVRGNVATVQ